ncbi:MAG TPA: cation:proton antiporter [Candidatus Woesearchaeota archaeon]|nr:cation:proton antiporter [Candidatus Woesearchaeota archaeon]
MLGVFVQLSLVLLVVLAISFVMRLLKQPLIIGYIVSGILIGPMFLGLLHDNSTLQIFSEFGIAFLLFIVGLHLSPRVIKEVGKISLITGIGQIVFTTVFGYLIGMILGFNFTTALYIAIALTFSSTIIIMKLLSDKDALDKLYGKISIGFLLVQDFVAIVILIVISSLTSGLSAGNVLFYTFIKGILLMCALVPVSIFILPKFSNFFAKSQEFLFLFGISFGLGLASLFYFAGFSIEVGALIAGIMLSISPYSHEINSKLKPLRDFFIISFFLILGSQMVFTDISSLIIPAIIFSLFILIGNPIIVMILMGIFGYSKKTGFMAGLTVAQISEFSLIVIAMGVKVGQISSQVQSFVTLIGLATIAGSTYLIMFSDQIYSKIERLLSIFERKNLKDKKKYKEEKIDYFLFGYNRIGFSILKSFSKLSKRYAVVDYNPETMSRLSEKGINCIYGDVEDSEFLDEIRVDKAKLIVSTIPDLSSNLLLLKKVNEKNKKSVTIVTARQIKEAFELYESGADYVILPHFLGGNHTAVLIESAGIDKRKYQEFKSSHLNELKERVQEGHEHPMVEKHR